ncbi:hypothetical protein MYK68_00445 [Gordonia sp. PP30]|uniref:hypothetical protein n=1 Tax=Gordonia sp. PP30 TaxID=2935861 RepID=UPI001FFEE6A1|nr:hypothetical protein [Gordonia sp. PP30]UQE75151.1 hypothetical protein MYK68_00445 [Gordonia sp. PP30]
MTPREHSRAIRIARRSAIESRHSLFLIAPIQYRRYVKSTDGTPMSWPEWHWHYRAAYRGTPSIRDGYNTPDRSTQASAFD